jgi:hypothetical protein
MPYWPVFAHRRIVSVTWTPAGGTWCRRVLRVSNWEQLDSAGILPAYLRYQECPVSWMRLRCLGVAKEGFDFGLGGHGGLGAVAGD